MGITKRVLHYIFLCGIFIITIFPQEIPGNQINSFSSYKTSDSLTILSWNIYLLPKWTTWFQTHKNYSWKKRTLEICKFLKTQNADIIVLQEAFNSDAVDIIKDELQNHYFYISDQFNKGQFIKTNSGLLLLSKFPIHDIKSISFNECASDDCMAAKGAFLISFQYNNQPFQLVGTHLQADYRFPTQYQKVRSAQLEQIKSEFKINDTNNTVFYCGDFNISYNHTFETENMINQLKVESPAVRKGQFTWQDYAHPTHEKFYYDYCLVDSRKENFNDSYCVQVIDSFNASAPLKLSDHYPVSLVYHCSNP